MVFSSYAMGLFGLLVVEFSLWNNFGNYIWYVSIGFTVLDMFIGDIVSYQLKEVCILLRGYHAQFNPISCGFVKAQNVYRPIHVFSNGKPMWFGAYCTQMTLQVLLEAPVGTGLGTVMGITGMGANDFMDFLLSYFVDLGLIMLFRVNIDPALGDILEGIGNM